MKIVIRNLEDVQAFLREVPRGGLKTALKAFAEYILGDESHGLKHYEPYKYVKPFRSYSLDPVKAARQRAWIFAHLDQIGQNNRTGATSNAWTMKPTNNGYGYTFENNSKGAKWLWGDDTQTRHQKAVGHRTVSSKIASNTAGAIRHAYAELKKWIAGKGKS